MQNSQINLDLALYAKVKRNVRDYYKLVTKHIQLIIDLKIQNIPKLLKFFKSYQKYKHLTNSEELHIFNIYPCINDDTSTTPYDPHYFYQGVWAFKKISEVALENHVDVGSEIRWVGLLSTITKVIFIDLRPFETDLTNLIVKKGDILNLPFEDKSVDSLSCLHVAEHIGLGRYGDKLDPNGTEKACKELQRVLAVNGNLYFSVPVGRQNTYFNAHRVYFPKTIIKYFKDLKLIELSGITDSGTFIENIDINTLENCKYALGLFWFRKEKRNFQQLDKA